MQDNDDEWMLRTAVLLAVTLLLPGATTTTTTTPEPAAPAAREFGASSAIGAPWLWPTDAPRVILRPFVAPASRYGAGHRGIDVAAGSAAIAPTAGIVHFAGVVVDRPLVSIEHPDGVLTSYEPVATTLRAGDIVEAGQTIGQVQLGHCSERCLHFGVRIDGAYVSPMNYFGGIPPAVLLPLRGRQ